MSALTDQRLLDTLNAIHSERREKVAGLSESEREAMRVILAEITALPRGSVRDERARKLLKVVLDEVTQKRVNQKMLGVVKMKRAEKRREANK